MSLKKKMTGLLAGWLMGLQQSGHLRICFYPRPALVEIL